MIHTFGSGMMKKRNPSNEHVKSGPLANPAGPDVYLTLNMSTVW